MSDTLSTHNDTCACCGKPIMDIPHAGVRKCDACGKHVCSRCASKMKLHHVKHYTSVSVLCVCTECSKKMQEQGNLPINPYTYIGGY